MNRRVTRSQVKVNPKPEPKASEDTMSVPQPKPSTSKSTSSSSSTVKSGPCSTSSLLPTTVNANDARARKMRGKQMKTSTADAEKSELPPAGKKKTRNDDDDKNELHRDLNYLNMLPPEVWEIIFKEVRDPLDFQALINSSASWRKLLEKEMTKFLFPLVFPILLEKSGVTIDIGDFKDYRAVCKTWDKGIQDYVERYYRNAFLYSMKTSGEMEAVNENFEDDDPRRNENYNYKMGNDNLSAHHYVFVTAETMDNFLNTFNCEYQKFKRNPILTGCVVISDFRVFESDDSDDDEDDEDDPGAGFLESSKSLLTFFGEHIHYLTIELGHVYSSTLSEFQSNVYSWLKDVPNLKGLILKYKAGGRQRRNEFLPLQEPPKLAHLQFLEVYNVPGVVFDGIVANATSLRKVSIQLTRQCKVSYADYFKPNPRFGEGPQMPLTMLNMNIRSRNDLVNLESSLQRGISLKIETLCIRFYQDMEVTNRRDREDRWNGLFDFGYKAGWNNIFIRYCYYSSSGVSTPWHDGHEQTDFFYVPEIDQAAIIKSDEWPEWSRLFRVVELLGAESLLKLSIRLPGTVQEGGSKRILAECPDLRLNLSRLKSLVIRIPNTTSIDFLLGMKNTLEEATLIFPHSRPVMSKENRLKERIKFNGHFRDMMSFNIWSEMPKLKKLTLRVAQKGKPAGFELKEFNYERPS